MKETLKRFLNWVESNGGPSAVAKRIGKTPQTFYNYRDRGSMPNMEVLELLVSAYQEFDVNYILTGQSSSARVKQLEYEVGVLNQMLDKQYKAAALMGKAKGAIDSPSRSKEIRKESGKATIINVRRSPRVLYLPGSVPTFNYTNL